MRYGFVTFTTASSAYDAVERASRDPRLADYNVAFGGRRQFCDSSYADLDGVAVLSYQNDEFRKMVPGVRWYQVVQYAELVEVSDLLHPEAETPSKLYSRK
ncbi:uncharacterized protein LOC113378930 [Ctenocephalides felis]|uniref:uncharacterized protein LOC113378930 n=1 Tax=Ctenocephalides felis TaxID=7515 RepID=UPI000E6E3094|nr:uncharacterized protein LOC113378930 [Ctenocephalides felis]